jgi:hypothetical protein
VEAFAMSDLEETGAIDWYLIESRGKEINGELVPPLLDLVDRRLIRILDALVLIKRADGSFDALTTEELDPSQVGELGPLRGASSGLLTDEDAEAAASALEPDSVGGRRRTSPCTHNRPTPSRSTSSRRRHRLRLPHRRRTLSSS